MVQSLTASDIRLHWMQDGLRDQLGSERLERRMWSRKRRPRIEMRLESLSTTAKGATCSPRVYVAPRRILRRWCAGFRRELGPRMVDVLSIVEWIHKTKVVQKRAGRCKCAEARDSRRAEKDWRVLLLMLLRDRSTHGNLEK